MLWRTTTATILLALVHTAPAAAQQESISFRVAGWNLESGESNDVLLRSQFAAKQGVHLWGLSEVRDGTALAAFEQGAEDGEAADFAPVLGTTGGGDRLAILYSKDRFDLLASEELFDLQPTDGQRAPLVAHLRGRRTGRELKFMVNHLARGNAAARLEQAQGLNAWARTQTVPVVAVGDYNFDYHVDFGDQGNRDAGFDALVDEGAFLWVKPERLVKTQADDAFVSVLDFVFVANPPASWTGKSTILEREGDTVATALDFDDDGQKTDHRPVDAVFAFVPEADPADRIDDGGDDLASREEIVRRLDELERSVRELRALVGPG